MFEGVTIPDGETVLGGCRLSVGLLHQGGQQLGLELHHVQAVLDGVLGQDHVVVDTGGVQHHRHEELDRLEELHSLGLQGLRGKGGEGGGERLLGVSDERVAPDHRVHIAVLLHHLLHQLLELGPGLGVSAWGI